MALLLKFTSVADLRAVQSAGVPKFSDIYLSYVFILQIRGVHFSGTFNDAVCTYIIGRRVMDGKDLEGSGINPIEILSLHLPVGRGKHEKFRVPSVRAGIQTQHRERHRYTNPLGE
jgi:hypothetical protein